MSMCRREILHELGCARCPRSGLGVVHRLAWVRHLSGYTDPLNRCRVVPQWLEETILPYPLEDLRWHFRHPYFVVQCLRSKPPPLGTSCASLSRGVVVNSTRPASYCDLFPRATRGGALVELRSDQLIEVSRNRTGVVVWFRDRDFSG